MNGWCGGRHSGGQLDLRAAAANIRRIRRQLRESHKFEGNKSAASNLPLLLLLLLLLPLLNMTCKFSCFQFVSHFQLEPQKLLSHLSFGFSSQQQRHWTVRRKEGRKKGTNEWQKAHHCNAGPEVDKGRQACAPPRELEEMFGSRLAGCCSNRARDSLNLRADPGESTTSMRRKTVATA